MTDRENLIPIETVLNDMKYGDGVTDAARAYFYMNYASDEQKTRMAKKEKREKIFFVGAFVVLILFVLTKGVLS